MYDEAVDTCTLLDSVSDQQRTEKNFDKAVSKNYFMPKY